MAKKITLTGNDNSIKHLMQADAKLAKTINLIGDITYEIEPDSFQFLIGTIIGQMLSNKVADVIFDRFYKVCGKNMTPENVLSIEEQAIRDCGISKAKTNYILDFTKIIKEEPDFFDKFHEMPDHEVMKRLTSFKGIGVWTAKMYLIFVLNRQDILPFEDGAFLQSYRWLYETEIIEPRNIKQNCSIWSPYSSIASRYLYRILDLGYTKYRNIDEARADDLRLKY